MAGGAGPTAWSVVSVPTTQGLTIVRGSASSDVWIAGDTTILRWDGHHWSSIPVPSLNTYPSAISGLWVVSSSDVWLGTGTKVAFHWTGAGWTPASLNDNRTARVIWGSASNNVWAADYLAGYIGHYDGTAWNHINSTDYGPALWGSGVSDVWMIEGNVIIHWRGATSISPSAPWGLARDTQYTSPRAGPSDSLSAAAFLQALWGSGTNDIWAVGDGGMIVHYDGRVWSTVSQSATRVRLLGVWGTGPNDVWAVGDGGVILHFDGFGWSKGTSPTIRTLRSVWGSPSGDVWAVGDSGTVLHSAR